MSDYNLKLKQNIKDKQLAFLSKQISEFSPIDTQDEALFQDRIRQVRNAYQPGANPLLNPIPAIRHQVPWKEDIQQNQTEIVEDIHILSQEQDGLGGFLRDSFNFVYSEQKRLNNRISKLSNLTGDLNLISSESGKNIVYFKESFQDVSNVDDSFAFNGVNQSRMWTDQGIITLSSFSSVNLSEEARILQMSGNGTDGGEQIVRKYVRRNQYSQDVEVFEMLSQIDPKYHAEPNSLLDNRPDTVFEYQMINVPESFKSARGGFNFEWAKGKKEGDRLRLKLTFDLGSVGPLNWVGLAPYFAYGSTGRLLVHSIQTSPDGFEFEPIYPDKQVLNQEVSDINSSQHVEDLFNGNTDPSLTSYTGQGVWVFPEKQTRYIELVLDQDQSYPEVVGQEVCYVSEIDQPAEVLIPMPEELKTASPGEYVRSIDGQRLVFKKRMEVTSEAWRYAIGLRDVYFMRYLYDQNSITTFKEYDVEGEISRIVLYANEIIPKEYQDLVETMNDWVVYEVSFDDINWVRMSPMHHEPVNNNFPPKILEVNGSTVTDDMAFQIHKAYIRTEGPANKVRLRITLNRPEGEEFQFTTPIVQDVALKIEKRSESL